MTREEHDPAAILADWAVMTLDEQRAVIVDYIDKVTIIRARPGLQRFDSDRVKIKWRNPLRPQPLLRHPLREAGAGQAGLSPVRAVTALPWNASPPISRRTVATSLQLATIDSTTQSLPARRDGGYPGPSLREAALVIPGDDMPRADAGQNRGH